MAGARDPVAMVLTTTELLEDILRRIDMKTLLLSQRVNRTFQATIEGSPSLQQKLFFATMPAGSSYQCTQPQCRDRYCINVWDWTRQHRNPFLSTLGYDTPILEVGSDEATISIFYCDGYPQLTLKACTPSRPASAAFRSGSWRRMLCCQTDLGRQVQWAFYCKATKPRWTFGRFDGSMTVEMMLDQIWPTE
ncbi:hypothetical protein LTR56_009482 [Elasticomyces elasticus]|nr:hypothetical protein LTR22_021502 [Elasticomyces elasticus]KAK3644817.1 hypothetical protein LTR56_009482 [Elasticomyces elasticus]KAK4930999.1 hypothetical protein LTR49_002414 [Elasticomyces elasticus]KAK5740328.1 hypothetical protein LTS12_024976 [Elasticomyces elasticus]